MSNTAVTAEQAESSRSLLYQNLHVPVFFGVLKEAGYVTADAEMANDLLALGANLMQLEMAKEAEAGNSVKTLVKRANAAALQRLGRGGQAGTNVLEQQIASAAEKFAAQPQIASAALQWIAANTN